MKPRLFSRFMAATLTILAFASVLYTSCTKPEPEEPAVDTQCIDVNCNNGNCFRGQCACNIGWEGFYCDIKSVQKYLGQWSAVETVLISNDTTNTSHVGDTNHYTFHIFPDGNSVTSFRLAGLMEYPGDTVKCYLGNPVDHFYEANRFYFEGTSLPNANVYLHRAGGSITTSGSVIDSLKYERWYDGVNQFGDTIVLKETVSVAAQKAP